MALRIQLRRGTAAEWTAANPLLAEGEMAVELDTGKVKVGNGTQYWNDLAYSPQPSAHAATHAAGGTDPITVSTSQVSGLTAAIDAAADAAETAAVTTANAYTDTAVEAAIADAVDASGVQAAGLYLPLADKGAAGGVATLGADGKVPNAQLPPLAISDTYPVSSQTAMLALTAEVGDIAVRTDLSKSFILRTTPASTLANWQELLTPPNAVLSVDGRTGAVTLADLYASATDPRLSDQRTPTDGSVTATKIAAGAVTGTKLALGAVTDATVSSTAAIAKTKIAGTAITAADTGTVTGALLADGAVTSAKIADGTIATADLADGAVTGAKIAPGSLTTTELADNTITAAKVIDGAVETAKVADLAVTTAKLADTAVTTAKLANGSVTADKLAPGAVAVGNVVGGPYGYISNVPHPLQAGATQSAPSAIVFVRLLHGGTITKIGVVVSSVATGSQTLTAAVYRSTGSGRSAAPSTLVASTNTATAAATGYYELTLPSPVTVAPGDWFALLAGGTGQISLSGLAAANAVLRAGNVAWQNASSFPATAAVGYTSSNTIAPVMFGVP